MKTAIRIKMTDNLGQVFWWTVQRQPDAVQVGVGSKPRKCPGWMFRDHEGCERFSEGNWLALVGMFREVAANYDLATTIS
jgi:hypothetical protein